MLKRLTYARLSDEGLMHRIQQGESGAFDEIYRRYHRQLFSYFVRMLGADQTRAEDFLQDTFLRVIEKAGSFQTNRIFSTWVFTIASNLCKNEYRRQAAHVTEPHEDMDTFAAGQSGEMLPSEQRVDQALFRQEMFRVLADLNPDHRDTFLLRYQQHFSIREISEIMDCSAGTVKSRLFYTLKRLSRRLSAFNPSEVTDEIFRT